MNSLPPYFPSQNFNALAFQNGTNLTKADLDKLYLPLAAGKNLYLIDAIVPGTVSASKAVIVDASKNITGFNTIGISRNTGDLLSLNTTDSNSRSTILFTTPSNTLELGIRGPTAGAYQNNFYRYSNGSYKYVMDLTNGNTQQFGQAVIETNGLNLTLKNGSETSILEHAASQLKISSSVSSSFLYLNSIGVGINASGSHLTLKNGAQTSFFEETSGGILRTVSGLSMNLDFNGLRIDSIGNTASARSRLDLGDSISDKTLGIYNNGTAFYGLSANNNRLQFSSNSAFAWFTACTDGSPINTLRLTLASNGVLTTTENVIMNKGFFVQNTSFSNSGRTGTGIACHMSNSTYGELFSYDYTGLAQKHLYIGNTMYVNGVGNTVNIANGINASLYPLSVGSSTSGNIGTYGFLNQSGTTGSTSVNPVPISIYASNRVAATEFNAYSDIRLKTQIKDIDTNDALDFIKKINAKSYVWKNDKNNHKCYGFIAQEILKNQLFEEIVSHTDDPALKEEIEMIDGKKFISPAGQRLNVSYQAFIPIIVSVLKNILERLDVKLTK